MRTLPALALALGLASCAGPARPALDPEARQRLDALPCDEVRELRPAFFDTGDDALPPLARSRLDENLYLLARCEALTVTLNGYANGWTEPGSEGLSTRRAEAVRRYYEANGLARQRIECVVGRGAAPGNRLPREPPEDPRAQRVDSILGGRNC